MRTFRLLTIFVALLLGGSEIARWWGNPRLVPLAIDELAIALALLAAAFAPTRLGSAPMAAAWGAYCGLILSLLVPTIDHLVHGPPKESAIFYTVILGGMLVVGLWAVGRALVQGRRSRRGR